jgi:hypothetical protein
MKNFTLKAALLTLFVGVFANVFAQDSIVSKNDLKSASKLFDVQFTQKEIDTLYSDVLDNIANYKAMHKLYLPNSVALSTWQLAVPLNTKKTSKGAMLELTPIALPTQKEDLATSEPHFAEPTMLQLCQKSP